MSKKNRGILATTAVVAAMTLCFKLLGFVKQAVVAYYFGTTFEMDTALIRADTMVPTKVNARL